MKNTAIRVPDIIRSEAGIVMFRAFVEYHYKNKKIFYLFKTIKMISLSIYMFEFETVVLI
jgi:hypothetical protein